MLLFLNTVLLFAWFALLIAQWQKPMSVFLREVIWSFACGMTTTVLVLSVLTLMPTCRHAEVADVRQVTLNCSSTAASA